MLQAGAGIGRVQASKGIAGRAVDAMKLGYALKTRVFDTLDWMCDASLLVGKQPATVVSTAIYVTLDFSSPPHYVGRARESRDSSPMNVAWKPLISSSPSRRHARL